MRLSEAKANCSDLILRECDSIMYTNAQEQLVQKLVSCSPKVASQKLGEFSLDASGLLHIGGESKFCHNVLRLCAKAGFLDAHIGIADSTFAAMMATRSKRRKVLLVQQGHDAEFLAPLSISHLGLDPEMEASLRNLGIKSMGQLRNLPVDSIIERFGTAGKLACELASGVDSRQPTLPEAPKQFECSIDMGGAISSLNEITFALKSILDRLTAELKKEALWAEEVLVSFYNEDEKFDERLLRLIRPSNQTKFLLEVIRLSLEANQLPREFTKIALCVSRFSKENWEQNFVDLPAISSASQDRKLPASLLLLLQRFMTRIGEDKVVKPIASDHYDLDHAGAWVPVTKDSVTDSVIPINFEYLNQIAGEQMVSDFVLRKCTSPTQVLVEVRDSIPASINYQKQWYWIKHVTVPEYLSGNWWEDNQDKTYYKILAEPTYLRSSSINQNENRQAIFFLLSHDQNSNGWFIEGFFD